MDINTIIGYIVGLLNKILEILGTGFELDFAPTAK